MRKWLCGDRPIQEVTELVPPLTVADLQNQTIGGPVTKIVGYGLMMPIVDLRECLVVRERVGAVGEAPVVARRAQPLRGVHETTEDVRVLQPIELNAADHAPPGTL